MAAPNTSVRSSWATVTSAFPSSKSRKSSGRCPSLRCRWRPKVVRGLINLRGQILTAIDLRFRLGLGEPGDPAKLMNVVVRTDESPVSFLVDEIGEVLHVDDDSFESPPETLQGDMRELIGGAYKLEGKLLLSLSTERTVNFSCAQAHIKEPE